MRRRPTVAAAACGEPALRRSNKNIALFPRVTLISKVQSTSVLDCFHARDLPCSHVQSYDDPISDCRGDSAVLYSFIYIDVTSSIRLQVMPYLQCPVYSYWSLLYKASIP